MVFLAVIASGQSLNQPVPRHRSKGFNKQSSAPPYRDALRIRLAVQGVGDLDTNESPANKLLA